MLDTKKIIPDFPILGKKINGKPLIYLDSTASSLKPAQFSGVFISCRKPPPKNTNLPEVRLLLLSVQKKQMK